MDYNIDLAIPRTERILCVGGADGGHVLHIITTSNPSHSHFIAKGEKKINNVILAEIVGVCWDHFRQL